MRRSLGRLVAIVLAAASLMIGGTYFLGPHQDVASAFARYKTTMMAGDGRSLANMTAKAELDYWESVRLHALSSGRDIVQALPFRHRVNILSLRKRVHGGTLKAASLAVADAKEGYIATLDLSQPSMSRYAEMEILFAVPTGLNSARGYFSLTNLPGAGLQKVMMALSLGAYFNFEQTKDGWVVDQTPMMEGSASENEYWATQQDPTGNTLIFNMLGAMDQASQDILWAPLSPQSQ